MRNITRLTLFAVLTLALMPPAVSAQQDIIPLDKVIKSQRGTVSQRIANTDLTIEYGRPVARGRTLFGSLVSYGRIWHPGADQATSIVISREVEINGKTLAAGKYSLWTIPGADMWTVIFNSVGETFHTSYPGETRDALRVDVKPEAGAHMETLAYYFPVVEGKDATLRLHWGTVVVPLAIKVQ